MYRRLRHHNRYNFSVSRTAANEIVTFVALEEAELLCTIVSDTRTTVIIPPQGLLQMKQQRNHGAAGITVAL